MKQKKFAKALIALSLALTMAFATAANVAACTGFYLGKDTTENGSVIWGRTEDISAKYSKLYTVHPAETHEPGSMYQDSNGLIMPYPAETLRYTLVMDSAFNTSGQEYPEPYASAGMNERNVAMSCSVTLSSGQAQITGTTGVDPMVRTGATEQSLTSLVLMQATSAKNAIEVIAHIVDTYGSAERNGITVSDPYETWYIEILSGHQYVAVKAPADKVGFSPNVTMLGAIDVTDTENVIASAGLVSVAQQAGTLVTDDNGLIKIAPSYARSSASVPGRMWLGYNYLKGQTAADALQAGYFEYYTAPREEKNYTLYEAMRLLAYRGEGTPKYAGNGTGNSTAIGNDGTVEAHVFEVRQNLPAPLATVEWLAMGPAEYSVYLPYYGALITETLENFTVGDSLTYNSASVDDNTVYWVFRQLFTLSKTNRELYGANVKLFWEGYQKKLIEQQAAIDEEMVKIYAYSPKLAEEKATALGKWVAKESYEYAKQLITELTAFIASGDTGTFMPTLLTNNVMPTYTFDAIGGTGLPNEEPTISAPASVFFGDDFTIKAVLGREYTGVKLVNEKGNVVGIKGLSVSRDGANVTWDITTNVGTAGLGRELTLLAKTATGGYEDIGLTAVFDVVKKATSSGTPAEVLNAVFSTNSAKVNQVFTVTVTTTTDASYVKIANENGKEIGKKLVSKAKVGSELVWIYEIGIGTKGARVLSFTAAKADGIYWNNYGSVAPIQIV